MPFNNLEVYQDFATASNNLPALHEAVATWLSLWALHCHLAKPGRLHFLNCSSKTKLAQPLLIILVILPLNCLYFVSLFSWQWPETKLTSYHFFITKHQLERGLSQSQRPVRLLRVSEFHVVQLPGLPQTHRPAFKIKIHLWCLGSNCQRKRAVLFSNFQDRSNI